MKLQLKQIYRKSLANKRASLLTLISLVITFLGVITLSLFVDYEFGFDKQHSKNIYHLKNAMYQDVLPITILDNIEGKLPEIKKGTVINQQTEEVSIGNNKQESAQADVKTVYTDVNFLQIFNFPFVNGESFDTKLSHNEIFITEKVASQFFGNKNAIGESLNIWGDRYTIKGILADVPEASTLQFGIIASIANDLNKARQTGNAAWCNSSFLLLEDETNIAELEKSIDALFKDIQPFESLMESKDWAQFFSLRPFASIHFDTSNWMFASSNPIISKVLLIFIVIVIIMGFVNYINFTGEQVPYQAKSTSLYNVFGASKTGIRLAINAEAIIWCIIALAISLVIHTLVYGKIHTLLNISGLQFDNRLHFMLYFILGSIVFAIASSYWSGKQLTNYSLSESIKGKAFIKGKTYITRNILMVLQFSIAIALSISAIVIEKQLNYWYSFDTGIDSNQVVQIKLSNTLRKQHNAYSETLLKNPLITDYTFADQEPSNVQNGLGTGLNEKLIQFKKWSVANNFIEFFNIAVSEGRTFQTENDADNGKLLVNKNAVAEINWSDAALGKNISTGDGNEGEIIGVFDNLQINSLHSETGPLQIYLDADKSNYNYMFLRVKPCNYKELFANIKTTSKTFDATADFEIEFINEATQKLYAQEQQMAKFIELVTIWCILIALIGMFGMTLFVTQNRTKEVSIRKINGASLMEILVLLNRQFVYIVAAAFVLAAPITYYLMDNWLANFTFAIQIDILVFVFVGMIALLISILVISQQTIRLGRRNPINALRYE